MVAFALTTARAFVGAPVATASIGGQAGKAAVAASARAVPAFARFGVAARLGLGVQTASPVAAFARVASARAFHLTAFAADEDGAEAAPAEGPVKRYVGNLSWGIDDAALGDIFAEYDASDMAVVSDMNTGRSRGFGFVTVANQAEADKCIASLDGMVRHPPRPAIHPPPTRLIAPRNRRRLATDRPRDATTVRARPTDRGRDEVLDRAIGRGDARLVRRRRERRRFPRTVTAPPHPRTRATSRPTSPPPRPVTHARSDRVFSIPQEVDGRPLRVNISVARGDRPPRPQGDRSYEFDARKIYFGNLSWGMDHLDLQDLCGEFGSVEDARLITDRETGRSRGFGFVTMSSAEEAEMVVSQLNGQDVDGRVLRVNIANVAK